MITNGSQLRFTFSEKAVGAGSKSNYLFMEGANPYTNLFSSIKGVVPDTDASTPDGLRASEYLAGKKETWVVTFGDLVAMGLVGKTVSLVPSLIVDSSNTTFALDAANSNPLQYKVVNDTLLPSLASLSSDTAAGYYKAGGAINVKVTFNKAVTLAGGILLLTLNTTPSAAVSIAPAGPANELSGVYTVAAGQNTTTGASLAVTALSLQVNGPVHRVHKGRPLSDRPERIGKKILRISAETLNQVVEGINEIIGD